MSNEVILLSGNAGAVVLPEKGATVSEFFVEDTNILYPYREIETPSVTKRRGGIPILFPNAGPGTPSEDEFTLPQHGFARDLAWTLLPVHPASSDHIVRAYLNQHGERPEYPYKFNVEYDLTVGWSTLAIGLEVSNYEKDMDLLVAPGIHPYFYVPSELKPQIETTIEGFDPKTYDWKTPRFFPWKGNVEMQIPGQDGILSFNASPNFKNIVIWSEPGEDFICLEAWVGGINAIKNPDERIAIKPGEYETFGFYIDYMKGDKLQYNDIYTITH